MYIVVIAWFYVVMLMAVVEAASSNGTVLGAFITFVLYGLLPLSIVLYIFGTPARKRKLRAQQLQERAAWDAQAPPAAHASVQPDASGHAAGAAYGTGEDAAVAPVRKKS